ncbi:unnamed protein product [Pleuronectes platessa]|uniref:Uncharacterized protein n=1 Tax=Pleuronectes platessa TaxID=8262 RepID=A0A9N7YJI9_PLEPL|nr:unnamed protein product [Pleuronectes platessa]
MLLRPEILQPSTPNHPKHPPQSQKTPLAPATTPHPQVSEERQQEPEKEPGSQTFSDSGLYGLSDAPTLRIKKGSIEICSGSKGYHGDHSTSNNNNTGTAIGHGHPKAPWLHRQAHKIKAKKHTLHISLDGASVTDD